MQPILLFDSYFEYINYKHLTRTYLASASKQAYRFLIFYAVEITNTYAYMHLYT